MEIRLRAGRGLDHTWQDEFHAFYHLLLPEPVIQQLRKAKTVVIIPHHILHYFPFVAMVTEPDEMERGKMQMVEPKFLLDEPFDLCYAPSLTAWRLLRQKPSVPIAQVNVLGIADFGPQSSLPGVEKDLANVKAVFGDRIGTLARDDQATEATAKRLFSQPGFLFVGTHGTNIADRPLSSYLKLRTDSSNDGHLTAEELFAADNLADLVVMSACYSGLADRSPMPGDDLFGIGRALLYSGSRHGGFRSMGRIRWHRPRLDGRVLCRSTRWATRAFRTG